MRDQILTAKYAFYSPYWDEISDTALDLISNLLVLEPNERFDVLQTSNHDWITEDTLEDDQAMPEMFHIRSIGRSNSMLASSEKSSLRTPVRSSSQPLSLRDKFASELNSITFE